VPTYEYVCRECGRHLEKVQSFSDKALDTCEVCGGQLRKVFGSVGIVFKGSGFYKTDSRSGSSAVKPAETTDKSGSGTTPEAAKKEGSSSGTDTPKGDTKQGDKVSTSPAASSSAPTPTAKVPATT